MTPKPATGFRSVLFKRMLLILIFALGYLGLFFFFLTFMLFVLVFHNLLKLFTIYIDCPFRAPFEKKMYFL